MWLPLPSWVVFVCFLCVAFAAVSGIMDRESDLSQGDVGEPSLLNAQVLLRLQKAVVNMVLRIRQTIVQSFVVSSVVVLLLWIAAFLYGSFYYSYMPRAAFSTPVHYYYRCVYEAWLLLCVWLPLFCFCPHSVIHVYACRTDCESPSSFLCTYPVANISLMRNKKNVCMNVCVFVSISVY